VGNDLEDHATVECLEFMEKTADFFLGTTSSKPQQLGSKANIMT